MSLQNSRKLKFGLAINEALHQMMSKYSDMVLIGQGVKSPWYVGNTCNGLVDKFSEARVIDTPVSENAITGAAVGSAIAGIRTVVVHPRVDFMMYALDPIINEAANWYYMNGGNASVPVVFWGIINRGGEQAAQHSQALQALFAHIPGLKVVMPATSYDAKGLLIAAIKDNNPVVFMDDRWLYGQEDEVPFEEYSVEIGKAAMRTEGTDVTIVGTSYMANEAIKASQSLAKQGISAEVIDLRTIKPIDKQAIIKSVKKTGRLVVAESGWTSFGVSAEIAAIVAEETFGVLKAPIRRIALPDSPAPANRELEKAYYPTSETIINAVTDLMNKRF